VTVLKILYGHPDDPEAFDAYYRDTHLPLARRIPDVQRLEAVKVQRAMDGSEPSYYVIAEMAFADRDTFKASMSSPEGQAAGQDVANFATGGVTMLLCESID
jgi:uncharacterized protein (TIGR02118 family)